jgi:zinc transport system ATP-binding protein
VLLALALHPLPDLLLLDEPVSGMDQAGTSLFYRMVSDLRRAYDLSILIISHDLAEVARFADRLVFLNRTILSDGPPADVLASPVVRQAFNLDLNVPDVVAPVTETRHHPPAGAAAGTGATGRGSA